MLNIQVNNPETMQRICGAIWTITLLKANRSRFIAGGVCNTLVRCLNMHMANSAVAECCCAAIRNVCGESNENRSRLGEVGAVEALTKACIHTIISLQVYTF